MAKKKQTIPEGSGAKGIPLTWEEFGAIKDRYIGLTAEFKWRDVICTGKIIRLEVDSEKLTCYCSNCFEFRGNKWQKRHTQEETFFQAPINDHLPVDMSNGTIKLTTSIRGEAYLKMRTPRQRA